MRQPIRDCRKEPWPTELESLRPSQAYYDQVARAQTAWEQSRKETTEENLIDPSIIEEEKQFARRGSSLQRLVIDIEEEEEEEEGSDIETITPRSVASFDSILQNADFIELRY